MTVKFPSTPDFVGALYTPSRFEGFIRDLEVEGEIPAELNGTFFQVSPDPAYPPMLGDDIFFNGDGAVTAFRFAGGHVDMQRRYVETDRFAAARAAGFTEVLGGEADGLMVPPHIFVNVPNDSPFAQTEQFAPIAPIIRAANEDDALRLANETEFGLSSAVFTRDVARGVRFARGIEAGMTHVNDISVLDSPFNMFGGEKNSGIGRFNGDWIIAEMTTDHWITVQDGARHYPF